MSTTTANEDRFEDCFLVDFSFGSSGTFLPRVERALQCDARSFRTTWPSFITNRTRSSSVISAIGFPATATRSTNFPGSTEPMRSYQPSISAVLTAIAPRLLGRASFRDSTSTYPIKPQISPPIRLTGKRPILLNSFRVLLPFTALFGLILISSRILSQAIWQLYIFYFALGIISGGAGAMPYTNLVTHWFDRHRVALSGMRLGMGLVAIVIPSVAQRLIATLGWRFSCTVFGLAILFLPLPVVAAFLKERPENVVSSQIGMQRSTPRRRALKSHQGCVRFSQFRHPEQDSYRRVRLHSSHELKTPFSALFMC